MSPLFFPSTTFQKYRQKAKPLDEAAWAQVDRLENLLAKFHKAASEGKMGMLRAELPERYIGTDRDVVAVPVRKISTGYGISKSVELSFVIILQRCIP